MTSVTTASLIRRYVQAMTGEAAVVTDLFAPDASYERLANEREGYARHLQGASTIIEFLDRLSLETNLRKAVGVWVFEAEDRDMAFAEYEVAGVCASTGDRFRQLCSLRGIISGDRIAFLRELCGPRQIILGSFGPLF